MCAFDAIRHTHHPDIIDIHEIKYSMKMFIRCGYMNLYLLPITSPLILFRGVIHPSPVWKDKTKPGWYLNLHCGLQWGTQSELFATPFPQWLPPLCFVYCEILRFFRIPISPGSRHLGYPASLPPPLLPSSPPPLRPPIPHPPPKNTHTQTLYSPK